MAQDPAPAIDAEHEAARETAPRAGAVPNAEVVLRGAR